MNSEMKPKDVMRALECCRYGGRCGECPCFEEPNCQALANDAALALLREKDAKIAKHEAYIDALNDDKACLVAQIEEKDAEIERLRERNITLEQKIMLLGIDKVYVFKAQVKGEKEKENGKS